MKKVFAIALIVLTMACLPGCFRIFGITPSAGNGGEASAETASSVATEKPAASTDREITFRGLEWGISSEAAEAALQNDSETPRILFSGMASIPWPETVLDLNPSDYINGDAGTTILLSGITAGGHEIVDCRMYFRFVVNDSVIDRENDSLYLATYSFKFADEEEVYQGLLGKLSELYGTGTEEVWDTHGYIASSDYSGAYTATIKETTWAGANNTFVTLRCKTSDNKDAWLGVWMAYGKTDAAEDLQELEEAIQREYAEQEKIASSSDNNSGL